MTGHSKDIFLDKSLVAVLTILQSAPELADLITNVFAICEANVSGHWRRGIAELLKKLVIAKINFSHFYVTLEVRG